MVVGQVGLDGVLVVDPVEMAIRNVLELAQNQRQAMAGNRAQEQPTKSNRATYSPALVSVCPRV